MLKETEKKAFLFRHIFIIGGISIGKRGAGSLATPMAKSNANPARAITWLIGVGVNIYCTIFK